MLPEQCEGCQHKRTEENAEKNYSPSLCRIYLYPELQHTRIGGCAAKANKTSGVKTEETFKLNPLKASKRSKEVKR